MRRLPLGVAISAAVHAGAVAWLAAWPPGPEHVADTWTATPIEIVTIDRPEPVAAAADVAPALEAPAVAPGPPTPDAPTASPARAAAPRHDDAAAVRAPAPAAGPTAETAPAAPSLLHMRRGEAPRLELPAGRWDALDRVPAGTAAERARATGQLHESGGGSYRFEHGGFVARVSPDGTVTLRDKPSASIHLALPRPKQLGRALADWYTSEKGRFGEGGDSSMGRQLQVTPGAPADPGNSDKGDAGDRSATVIVPVLGGGVDVTDWLARRHGIDPYASKKLALLDSTRDERVAIGNQHRAQQLALTPQIVRRNLQRLWDTAGDARARKRALFELWDECADSDDASGDASVVAAGQAARRMVIGFIRAHLPAGSADAYTAAELAELARIKHSSAAFSPYEDAPPR